MNNNEQREISNNSGFIGFVIGVLLTGLVWWLRG